MLPSHFTTTDKSFIIHKTFYYDQTTKSTVVGDISHIYRLIRDALNMHVTRSMKTKREGSLLSVKLVRYEI